MNSLPAATHGRRRVGWTFVDMLLVIVLSVAGTILFAVAFGVVLAALGLGDGQQYIRDHPVTVTAAALAVVYGMLLVVAYLWIVRRRNVGWSAIGFRPPPLLPLLLSPIIVIGQFGTVAITNLLIFSLIGQFENPQTAAISGGQGFSWLNFGLMLLLAGVVAPIAEEVLFRGLLYGWLRSRMPIALAVILSAAVFAAAHVIPLLMPALFLVGIILAVAYELSGSLWLSILLHSLQNSLSVALVFAALALGLPVG